MPDKILTDNGGEFNNNDIHDMSESLSQHDSSWSSGTCKRHSAVVSTMLDKIIDETWCNLDIALAYAINAKNSLNNVLWFFTITTGFWR